MTSEKIKAAGFSDTSTRLHGVTFQKTAIFKVTEGIEFLYIPGQALGAPGSSGSQISRKSAH